MNVQACARVGAVVGAILGLVYVAYHNAHVSVFTGGYYYNGRGYFLAAVVGASVGWVTGKWIGKALESNDN